MRTLVSTGTTHTFALQHHFVLTYRVALLNLLVVRFVVALGLRHPMPLTYFCDLPRPFCTF